MRVEQAPRKPGLTALLKNGTALVSRPLHKFIDDEEGTVTAFAFVVFIMMLVMGGIALDTMRHEASRAALQSTLDRAVLAGATARSDAEARATVEDYFAKAGLSDYLLAEQEGDIDTTLNSATVTARAQRSLDTYLMKFAGVHTLGVSSASSAAVNIPNLEGILVLDVSGSMDNNSKITNLKTAAKEFVTTMVGSAEPDTVTMSIVPFSFSVSPPETIYNALAVDNRHEYSTCLEFADNDYHHATLTSGSSSLSSGIPANQMIYTSHYGGFDDLNQPWRSCYNNDYMRILPYSTSETVLHAKIDSLQPDGNTSGNEGMNWGAALLDPTFRQVTSAMIDAGELSSTLAHVPADYDDPETLKTIIFMGDGENTTSYFFDRDPPKYRGKFSNLYEVEYQDRVFKYAYKKKNIDVKRYGTDGESKCNTNGWECFYEATGPKQSVFYIHSSGYNDYYSVADDDFLTPQEFSNLNETIDGYIQTIQLDWEIAWGLMSPYYYGQITGDWDAWNDYRNRDQVTGSQKNVLMQKVCDATKTENVVVYTIGFEVPKGGTAERELKKCATSPSHYFPANGIDIKGAFSAIAANVKQLRLTQ